MKYTDSEYKKQLEEIEELLNNIASAEQTVYGGELDKRIQDLLYAIGGVSR